MVPLQAKYSIIRFVQKILLLLGIETIKLCTENLITKLWKYDFMTATGKKTEANLYSERFLSKLLILGTHCNIYKSLMRTVLIYYSVRKVSDLIFF